MSTEAQIKAKQTFSALNKGKVSSNLVFTNQSLGKDKSFWLRADTEIIINGAK